MKKCILMFFIGLLFILSGCDEKQGTQAWACTVLLGEDSNEYVFASEEIQTQFGELSFYHKSELDIEFCLAYEDENGETIIVSEFTSKPYSTITLYQGIEDDIIYKIGIRVPDTVSGTEVCLYVIEPGAPRP